MEPTTLQYRTMKILPVTRPNGKTASAAHPSPVSDKTDIRLTPAPTKRLYVA